MRHQDPIYFAPQRKLDGGWLCFKSSPSPPPAPDYRGAAQETSAGNLAAAQQAQQANFVNQNTPYGSISYTQDPTSRFEGGNPSYSSNINLSPTGAALLNASDQSALGLAGLQQNALQATKDTMGRPFDASKVPAMQTSLDTSGVPGMPQASDAARTAAENAAYGQATSRLDPQWKQQDEATRTQLANQGLSAGGEAYTNAMRDQAFAKNDAYGSARNAAVQQGLQSQQTQFGMGLAANQQGFGQAQAAGNFQNTAAQNALAQQQTLYNLPLNELNALRTGSQVSNPQFGQSPQQQTTTGANYLGAAQAQGQYDQGLYNTQVGSNNSMNSGLMTAAAAAAAMF